MLGKTVILIRIVEELNIEALPNMTVNLSIEYYKTILNDILIMCWCIMLRMKTH